MIIKKVIIVLTFLFILGLCINANAQMRQRVTGFDDVSKVAQAGFTFLEIPVSARADAMGNAAVTLEGSLETVFHNPAGIASLNKNQVFVSYGSWIADMSHQAVAIASPVKNIGVFAITMVNMQIGEMNETIPSNSNFGYEIVGSFTPQEYAIGIAYGKQFTDKFKLGIRMNYCSQDLYADKISAFAFDIGTIYSPGWKSIKIAMSMQNFSREHRYVRENFSFPVMFNVGISTNVLEFFNPETDQEWNFVIQGNHPKDYSERVHVGTEFFYKKFIALRTGYKFNYTSEGLTLGVGLVLPAGICIDYSFNDRKDIFNTTNRISASVAF